MASLHPARKVDRILELATPQSVLDAGCGTGRTVVYLRDRGIEVLGVEFSRVAIKHSPRPDLIVRHDLRKPVNLGRTFDLVWCFEVAEHIHPKFVDIFVDTLVRHGRLIVLSAAHPGQGGEGHFNEQPQSYWEKRFEDRNYQLHKEWTAAMRAVDEFYSGNMMVFQHGRYS
jgi:SAM-dependent methyltransferase